MATGGPDEETWKSMSPLGKKIYWAAIVLFMVLMLIAVGYKLLR